MNDERRNSWCRGYYRNPPAVAAHPFLLVDRVINMRGDQHGVGIKNLTMNEWQFGHSAENPVMPGVLVIEGIAQTACVLALRLMPPTERRRIMFFMSIDKSLVAAQDEVAET